MSSKGKLIVLSGPSGVGKGTIVAEAAKICDVVVSVSATTRVPGRGEKDGVNYWFMSREEFEDMIKKGLFLEYAEVFGNLYGTRKDKTDRLLETGKSVILEIDVQGGLQVRDKHPCAVLVFVLPPSMGELEKRLRNRGRDDEATIKRRLAEAEKEIAAAEKNYTHFIVNDELEKAVRQLVDIIEN